MHSGKLNEINDRIAGRPIDAFICCASFEDRSSVFARHIENESVRRAWIIFSRDYKDEMEENLNVLKTKFVDKNTLIEVDLDDPLRTADKIQDGLSEILEMGPPKRVVVDITSFTRETLLILLNILTKQTNRQNALEFVYIHANEYSTDDGDNSKKWLSKGCREVRSVLGYSGNLVPTKPNHLIVLLGFEDERALNLIYECNPARISLGIADKQDRETALHQERNRSCLLRLQRVLHQVEDFSFSGYDAKATKAKITEIISRAPEYNTIVAPMNTKISTLGAAILALEDPSIQICYARATIYNAANYSVAGSNFFYASLREISESFEHQGS